MKQWEHALPILAESGADAMIVRDTANIRYLTGYTNDTGVLVLTKDGTASLLTDFRFLFQAKAEAKDCEILDVTGTTYQELIAKILAEHGSVRAAFERDITTYGEYEAMRKACSQELIPVDNVLIELRKIKTEDELTKLRRAE